MLKNQVYELNRQPYTALLREKLLPAIGKYLAIDAVFDNCDIDLIKSLSYNLFCIYTSAYCASSVSEYYMNYRIPLVILLMLITASFPGTEHALKVKCIDMLSSIYGVSTAVRLLKTVYVNSATLTVPVYFMNTHWTWGAMLTLITLHLLGNTLSSRHFVSAVLAVRPLELVSRSSLGAP